MSNTFKTTLLLGLLTGLLVLIGGHFGGRQGMVIALVFAGIHEFWSYWFSDRIVLAMYRAQEVQEADAPELFRHCARPVPEDGMPMPKVYIIPNDAPNAFATGARLSTQQWPSPKVSSDSFPLRSWKEFSLTN